MLSILLLNLESLYMNNNDSNLNLYLKALQELKEDDFSRNVLKPLFESMSFLEWILLVVHTNTVKI